jgi:hypothetical protein
MIIRIDNKFFAFVGLILTGQLIGPNTIHVVLARK